MSTDWRIGPVDGDASMQPQGMSDTRLNRTAVTCFSCIVVPLVGWIFTLVLAPLALRQIRIRRELGRGLVIAAVWIVIAQAVLAIACYLWLGHLFADG